jgi:predicted HicB family RNase H-like nuclease
MDNTESTPVVFPVRFPPDTEISEIDLDEEEVIFEGKRLTDERAEQIAQEVLDEHQRRLKQNANLARGRKSLTGGAVHSPRVQFRVPEEIRERAEQRAQDDHVSLSVLARRALEQYLA